MDTNQFEGEEFEGGVVTLLCVVEMDEEEDVSPDVMFIIYVVLKTLENIEESSDAIVSVIVVKRSRNAQFFRNIILQITDIQSK